MKNYLFLIFAVACFTACQSRDANKRDLTALTKDSARFTSIKWIDSVKNIGTVIAGKKAAIQFRFKNTGDKPLFIISAEPGYGCTIADYPKQAISPGAEGLISAAYDVHAEPKVILEKIFILLPIPSVQPAIIFSFMER